MVEPAFSISRPIARGIAHPITQHKVGGPQIVLSNASQAENTSTGTTIGTLSVVGGTGSWTFTKTVDPDSAFTLTSGALKNAIVFNYETKNSYSVTIQATNGTLTINRTITISVTNVLETTLNALTIDDQIAEPGVAWSAAITGKSSGSTITATSSDGTVLSVVGTTVSGTFASTGTPNVTLRETHADGSNSPRDSVIAVTVADALPVPVASWVSGTEDNTPELSVNVPDGVLVEDDAYAWQFDTVNTFDGADFFEVAGTVNETDALDGDITETITVLADGTWYARFKVAGKTDWSNTISQTIAYVFDPIDLFDGGRVGRWWDSSDLSTLWQDTAGTTPATADGDPVRRIDDKSGGAKHLLAFGGDAARGILRISGGVTWVEWDSATDMTADPFEPANATMLAGVKTDGVDGMIMSFSGAVYSGAWENGSGSSVDFGTVGVGAVTKANGATITTRDQLHDAIAAAPSFVTVENMVLAGADVSGGLRPMRYVDGFKGNKRFYGMVIVDDNLTSGEIAAYETWLEERMT